MARKPKIPKSHMSDMRRFVLVREEDVSGTSGVGPVAEGIMFSNGQVVVHWLTQLESVAVYSNVEVCMKIHGHDGKTKISWVDDPPVA